MNRIIITILGIFILLNISCVRKKTANISVDPDDIKLSNSTFWNDSCLAVSAIIVTDSLIWIHSDQDDKEKVSVYSKSGNLIAKGISYGNGPGEILEVTSIHPYSDDAIAIYDSKRGIIQKISVSENRLSSIVLGDSLYMNDDALILQDSIIVTLPVNSAYSYFLYDMQGNRIDSLSYFPPKPEGMDDKTHQLACTGSLATNVTGQNMMRSILYDGGVDFFKIEDGKIKHTNRFALFDMDYDALDLQVKVPVPNDESKTGYSFVYATDKYFYASYSESSATENPNGECEEVHVFDFDGNIIKKIHLNKTFTAFAIDSNDETIYIASDQGENMIIYKYDMTVY